LGISSNTVGESELYGSWSELVTRFVQ